MSENDSRTLKEFVEDALKMGHIRPSKSSWGAMPFPIAKKGTEERQMVIN
jgi:hypothetical protein